MRLQLQQQNVPAAAIYTEYTVTIPAGATEVALALRGTVAKLFWYTATTDGSTPGNVSNLPSVYNTIQPATQRIIRGLLGGQKLFFQVDTVTQVLEVSYYSDK